MRPALDALARRLGAANIPVEAIPTAEADLRGVHAGIALTDPAGTRLEAFHGAETTPEPFVPGRPISGFRTGALGLGHVVLRRLTQRVHDRVRLGWALDRSQELAAGSR